MAETELLVAPAKIQILNTGDKVQAFMCYKQNFTTVLQPHKGLEFEVKTSGEVIYYKNQATEGLSVEVIENFTVGDENIVKINVPAKITIQNVSDKVVGFVPYGENFTYYVQPGDTVELTAANATQAIYYRSGQDIDGTLEVEQFPVE